MPLIRTVPSGWRCPMQTSAKRKTSATRRQMNEWISSSGSRWRSRLLTSARSARTCSFRRGTVRSTPTAQAAQPSTGQVSERLDQETARTEPSFVVSSVSTSRSSRSGLCQSSVIRSRPTGSGKSREKASGLPTTSRDVYPVTRSHSRFQKANRPSLFTAATRTGSPSRTSRSSDSSDQSAWSPGTCPRPGPCVPFMDLRSPGSDVDGTFRCTSRESSGSGTGRVKGFRRPEDRAGAGKRRSDRMRTPAPRGRLPGAGRRLAGSSPGRPFPLDSAPCPSEPT